VVIEGHEDKAWEREILCAKLGNEKETYEEPYVFMLL